MHLRFFGVGEKPFGPGPDTRFLFMAAPHREALDQLVAALTTLASSVTGVARRLLARRD